MERPELKGRTLPGLTDPTKEQTNSDDILSEGLGSLFDLKPINFGSTGTLFNYCYNGISDSDQYKPTTIILDTPDTSAANWSLHASSIWVSAIYMADHIARVGLPSHPNFASAISPIRVLELGASAGLPGILTAKLFPEASITVSDYPDERLIKTLSSNVELNNVGRNCRAVPHAWGSDVSNLLDGETGFDVILAADTLWNSDVHGLFVESLAKALKRCPHARVNLAAGLHTGRYTIQAFLRTAEAAGLEIQSTKEYEVDGTIVRGWDVHREGEDDRERRRWVVWVVLKWQVPKGQRQ